MDETPSQLGAERRMATIKTPGVIFALAMAVSLHTAPGDAVLIQSPVYYPFSEVIADNGRRLSAARWCSAMITFITWMADFEKLS